MCGKQGLAGNGEFGGGPGTEAATNKNLSGTNQRRFGSMRPKGRSRTFLLRVESKTQRVTASSAADR